MFPITALVPLNILPSVSHYPEVYALVLLFPKTPKRTSIIKAFISYFSVFIAYCFKNVNIIIRMKQKGTCIYIMPLNDIIKYINEGLDGGIWNSLISKNLAHYSLSLKFLLIL